MLSIILSQWFLYTACFLWRISTKLNYRGIEYVIGVKRPFILASNHRSKSDPFLLSLLPLGVVRKFIPIRFPTTSLYFDRIFYRLLISPVGAYRMERWSTSLEEYMKETVNILNDGGVVLIFPEGKIARSEEDRVAKPGLAYLAKKTSAPIVPLRIKEISKGKLFRRAVVEISFGESIFLQDADFSKDKLTQDSQRILDVIYKL
jgi:1-acyl-sn-glycerol-3-phosphate acyltransferase